MKQVTGGVCAAQGFSAAGIHCGIRRNQSKRDLALIYSAVPASAAAVYTSNLVKGAPLTVTKTHLSDGKAQAIVCNSGNANTCNADGIAVAEEMSALTADVLHIAPQDVIVASTGVIGQPLDLAPIRHGLPQLAAALGDQIRIPPERGAHARGKFLDVRHGVLERDGRLFHIGRIDRAQRRRVAQARGADVQCMVLTFRCRHSLRARVRTDRPRRSRPTTCSASRNRRSCAPGRGNTAQTARGRAEIPS